MFLFHTRKHNYLSTNNSINLPLVVEVVGTDIKNMGKITIKIKAIVMKQPSRNSSIDAIDVQHGNVAHRDLNFQYNHSIDND